MRIIETALAGAFRIEIDPLQDDRGFFARTYCRDAFAARGLDAEFRQCSLSYNKHAATLRGMHYQAPPYEEHKLVRCSRGAIFDVIVDLRPSSPTYRRWLGAELTASNRLALFVPPGFAHGFLTLEDAAEVSYMISAEHSPNHARGFRWNDPAVSIAWPFAPKVIAARDAGYPLLDSSS